MAGKEVVTKTAHMAVLAQGIRVAANAFGSYLFGAGIVESAEYQSAVGAFITLCSVAWWGYGLWKQRHST